MYRYLVEFVCTRDGDRTNGAQMVERSQPLRSLRDGQESLTGWLSQEVAQNSGSDITDLTITNIQIA